MNRHKQNLIAYFRQKIHLPEVLYYAPTQIGGRFCYTMDGETHYLHITTHKEQCEILHSQNMIDGYNEKSMWVIGMKLIVKLNGSFNMEQEIREVQWSDFTFSADQALEIVATHEFHKEARKMNLPAAVIRLFTPKSKAA